MKVATKILISAAIVFALCGIIVALAFVPAVQKWAVTRAIGGDAEIGHLSAGMSSAKLRDVTIRQDGAVIRVPAANAEYSAWSYITGSGIRVGKVEARGVLVDLRSYAPKDATTESAGFDGIFGAAALPPGLQLGSADIGIELILPAPGNPDGKRATLNVKGGGVGAGNDATFDYNATFTDPSKEAAVSNINATGRLTFTAAADGAMDKLSARVELQAEGEGIPKGEKIVLDASARRSPGAGESFQLGIARQGVAGVDAPLVTAAGSFNPASKALEGTWAVSVDNDRLASVLPAGSTPEFDVHGEGRFSVKSDTGESTASGEIKGSVSGLERIVAGLESVGKVVFNAAFAGAADPGSVRIESIRASVATQQGATLLSIATLQAVTFNPESGQVSFKDPATDLARMEISEVPVAWAAPFVEGYKLQGGTASGIFLVQSTPTGDRVRLHALKPFAVGPVTVSNETQVLLDDATVSATPEVSYTAERIEAAISAWSISTTAGDRIEGTARATVTQGAAPSADFKVTLNGRLPAMLKRFSSIDMGTVAIDGSAEGSATSENLGLRFGRLVVQGATGVTLLSTELKQPIDLNLATMQPAVKNPAAPAASVSFGSLPLGWAEPFVPNGAFGGTVESGAMDLIMAKEGPALTATKPLVLRAVSVSLGKKALVDRLDVTWDGSVAMKGTSMSAIVRSLEVRQGTTGLLSLNTVLDMNGETDPKTIRATAKGRLEANLGALLAQPAAADWSVLESGRLSADFEVAAEESIKVVLKAQTKGLVAKQDRKQLGDATVNVDARVNLGKDGEFRMPVTVLNSGRKSELLLTGNFTQRDNKTSFKAQVAGETVYVDDLSALAALAPSGEPPAPAARTPAEPRNTKRDEEPVWADVEGTAELDIKKLVASPDKPITNLKALVVITADKVALDNFSGDAGGGQMSASGALRFVAADREPYALDAKFKVPGLDMATIFTSEAPGKPATLETVVVAEGTATGRGLNLEDLIARAQGRLDVTGGKGVYRGLARSTDMISTGAGLVGALFGGQKVQNATQAVSELATELRELRFDQMKLKVSRGADLKLNIETLELISPTMRLSGKGVVNMDPDLPLARQAQRLEMRLGFKGDLGERMVARRMTDGNLDDLGYARFRVPITLTGNLLSPDSKQFWESVTRSVMEMGVQSFLGGG